MAGVATWGDEMLGVPSSVVAVDALAQVSPHRSVAAGACGT
jgi:hypothetical protein